MSSRVDLDIGQRAVNSHNSLHALRADERQIAEAAINADDGVPLQVTRKIKEVLAGCYFVSTMDN